MIDSLALWLCVSWGGAHGGHNVYTLYLLGGNEEKHFLIYSAASEGLRVPTGTHLLEREGRGGTGWTLDTGLGHRVDTGQGGLTRGDIPAYFVGTKPNIFRDIGDQSSRTKCYERNKILTKV